MIHNLVKYAILFIVLVLVQVLVCNHIMPFGVAAPVIFIYFILTLPIKLNTNWVLTLSFLLGFIIDVFSDTPGVNAISCTILGMTRRPIFHLYISKDETEHNIEPAISTIGLSNYIKYAATCTAAYCLIMFSLEYFSFTSIIPIIIKTISSAVLSLFIILSIDSLIHREHHGKRL